MKIGILTFHRPINYGAFLQAYSLSNQLKKCFEKSEVEIIDYIAPKENKTIYLNVLRTLKYYGVDAMIKEIAKIKIFRKSLKYLNLSNQYFCKEKVNDVFEYINKHYDVLIIGSDAVFNWNQNGYPSAFIPQYQFDIPVVTYAASVHGLRYKEEEQYKISECAECFRKMKFIGVRDRNTEEFVKYCEENVLLYHCCDPTVLMDFDRLYKIPHRSFEQIMKKYKIDISKKYIILMLEDQEISEKFYNKYSFDYEVISLFKKNKYADTFMYDLSPIEWALVLKNATLVITNFFHGTLLALTQNVPTIVVDLSEYDKPYEGKLKDLMETRFNVPELYVKKSDWDKRQEELLITADKCIEGKYKKVIVNGIHKEGQSFNVFEEKIREIL